ncbi:TonB-dependent receptor [Acinetobacter gerneri DSM 14967 = CIP 107464 = MTCC 9824]|uniref:Tip attachment protein J domain-containing protein n=2 Tax=Acinetobacter gerneri TaxID=202952 RepID=N8YDA0_9GAMM|nr:host specificity factor TipJ family phage tail protein [Acinetobacter gerneri]ENV34566.1 hypothetical protein F960_01304 [Acinetobacter gerneri DSM 14967 = CIP 107464 = MTCC 9824]EPR82882.1 TonB-dependent receptor [Acinetobacter gerneri DSM 14967 = CIP 107464 = MTCC 9824]
MKKVIIVPDLYDKSKNETFENVEKLEPFLVEYFNQKCPENLHVYHGEIAENRDITPKNKTDIEYLEVLNGVFYVVIYPSNPFMVAFWIVTGIMAAFSVYSILTMPKANTSQLKSSNNELANRSNQARVKARIPDIYGQVRAYADLIAQPYTFYDASTGLEVEYTLMVIGRGYYKIHDCQDGETDIANINGCAVSIFDPNVDIVSGTPIYQVGSRFTEAPLYTKKSSSINGQTLEKPNDDAIESQSIYFEAPNIIRTTSSSIDFTKYFSNGDNVAIHNAQFGTLDQSISGAITAHSNLTISIVSDTYIDDVGGFKALKLSGVNVAVVTTLGEGEEAQTHTDYYDISGDYDISSVGYSVSGSTYTYLLTLQSPKVVNYNWNYITVDSETVNASATFAKNEKGVDLSGTYTITNVSGYSAATSTTPAYFSVITLTNPSAINDDWDQLTYLNEGTTLGQVNDVQLNVISNKWVGWFDVEFTEAEGFYANLYWQTGLYWQSKSGRQDATQTHVIVEYQQIDAVTNQPIGQIYKKELYFKSKILNDFGRTLNIDFSDKFIGSFRFRICFGMATDSQYYGIPKVKDVYAFTKSTKTVYENVTTWLMKTVATSGALSVKERKANALVTRKLEVDGTGELVATKDAGQALINLALDKYVGRRSIDEVDIEQIKTEILAVKNYFNSSGPTEFSYTFDDDSLSFEEQAGMIASACFCQTTRFGNKLRLKFEKPQENSVLLFNHRNKVPSSEKRTYSFGIEKDYDGIELEYTSPDDDARVTYTIPSDSSAINPMKITTSGIRNEAVAKTRAWREWNKLRFQNVAVEFDGLDESNLLMINDRILVADNTISSTQDGEVESIDALTLTLSQDVIFDESSAYYCYLQLSDGSVDMIQCFKTEYSNEVLLSRAPKKALVLDPDRYAKTTYSIVKSQESKKQAFMLSEMSPNDAMTNKLTCINYDDRYYEMDHSFI